MVIDDGTRQNVSGHKLGTLVEYTITNGDSLEALWNETIQRKLANWRRV